MKGELEIEFNPQDILDDNFVYVVYGGKIARYEFVRKTDKGWRVINNSNPLTIRRCPLSDDGRPTSLLDESCYVYQGSHNKFGHISRQRLVTQDLELAVEHANAQLAEELCYHKDRVVELTDTVINPLKITVR